METSIDIESTGNYEADIESLADDIEKNLCRVNLDGGRGRGSPACLISKVKPQVRRVDESQYNPQTVFVGAYHHRSLDGEDQLKKWTALRRALPDDGDGRTSTLRRWLVAIAKVEDQASIYYGDHSVGMNRRGSDFREMLLLDGCYILHIFKIGVCSSSGAQAGGEAAGQSASAVDYIVAVRDVFYLLENQIPFFVLEKIHDLLHSSPPTGATENHGSSGGGNSTVVVEGFLHHLRSLLEFQDYSKLELDVATIRPCHLVHLLHMHFRPARLLTPAPADGTNSAATARSAAARATVYRWRGATLYHAAGVRFKKRPLDGGARCILDVELRRLTLHVPTLTVDNNTWRILRNLVALEQNNPHLGSHVTAYSLFMSQLAGTARDVELLARKGIIVHFLATDEDVANGFASLCRGVALDLDDADRNYLQETWKSMERWYNSRPVNWMALLRRRHLSNPLVAIALLAAIAGLVCEVLQTVCAIKSYKQGP